MIIRSFEKADIEQCAVLHKASRRASEVGIIYESDLDRYDLEHFITQWSEWSEYKETRILVAEDKGDIIGFIMYGPIRTRPSFDKGVVPRYGGEIYALYVDPERLKKGIGTALFQAAIEQLVELKLTSMLLWAMKKNKRACAFYESFGGERIGKQKVDVGDKSWVEESCFGWRDIRKIQK